MDYGKIKLKKNSYDVTSVTSSLLRHQKYHQTNVTRFFTFGPLPIKISGYVSALLSHFMILTSLNTDVAIKNKECIRLLKAHLPYFFRQANGKGCS